MAFDDRRWNGVEGGVLTMYLYNLLLDGGCLMFDLTEAKEVMRIEVHSSTIIRPALAELDLT